MRRPRDGAHSGGGYRLENGLVGDLSRVGGNRHSPIQDIESKPIRAANERPYGLPKDGYFFSAIKSTDLIGTNLFHCGDIATGE